MDQKRFERAVALRDTGQVEAALSEFRSMVESAGEADDKASLAINEARCYRLLGRHAEAEQRLAAARLLAQGGWLVPYIDYEVAVLRWHEGKPKEALRTLDGPVAAYAQASAAVQSQHRELYELVLAARGMLLADLARYREAVPLLEECLSLKTGAADQQEVAYNLGLCYSRLGDWGRAAGCFENAIAKGPETAYATEAHCSLGTIHYNKGAFAKAHREFEVCLERANQLAATKAQICTWLAHTSRALGMRDEAERYERMSRE